MLVTIKQTWWLSYLNFIYSRDLILSTPCTLVSKCWREKLGCIMWLVSSVTHNIIPAPTKAATTTSHQIKHVAFSLQWNVKDFFIYLVCQSTSVHLSKTAQSWNQLKESCLLCCLKKKSSKNIFLKYKTSNIGVLWKKKSKESLLDVEKYKKRRSPKTKVWISVWMPKWKIKSSFKMLS